MTYIAANRFRIVKGLESEFEGIWKSRNTYLESEPGFISFNLLKGPENEDHVLYTSTLHGSPNLTLLSGPSQKHSEKLTREPAVEVTFTWGTRKFEVFKWLKKQAYLRMKTKLSTFFTPALLANPSSLCSGRKAKFPLDHRRRHEPSLGLLWSFRRGDTQHR